jgi:Protein of Unknown function (DUF2784)
MAAALLADAVLLLHALLVLFVIGLPTAVPLGNTRGWTWVNRRGLRLLHAGVIGTVVAEAWLGVECPLTTLEAWLRLQAGQPLHGQGFVAHWVGRALFYDAPAWVFTLVYIGFGVWVVWTWWRWPPR